MHGHILWQKQPGYKIWEVILLFRNGKKAAFLYTFEKNSTKGELTKQSHVYIELKAIEFGTG